MEPPEGSPTRDEIINIYIKTLASVVGSEEEARMRIYLVSTRSYYAFGVLGSEELAEKISGAGCSVAFKCMLFVINFVFWIFTAIFIKTFQNAREFDWSFPHATSTLRTKTMEGNRLSMVEQFLMIPRWLQNVYLYRFVYGYKDEDGYVFVHEDEDGYVFVHEDEDEYEFVHLKEAKDGVADEDGDGYVFVHEDEDEYEFVHLKEAEDGVAADGIKRNFYEFEPLE